MQVANIRQLHFRANLCEVFRRQTAVYCGDLFQDGQFCRAFGVAGKIDIHLNLDITIICPNVKNFCPNNGQFSSVRDTTAPPAYPCRTLMFTLRSRFAGKRSTVTGWRVDVVWYSPLYLDLWTWKVYIPLTLVNSKIFGIQWSSKWLKQTSAKQ